MPPKANKIVEKCSSKRSCKPKRTKRRKNDSNCVIRCSADVHVDLNADPSARCSEVTRSGTEFDVALGIRVDPRCRIEHKGTVQDGCDFKCVFGVGLDFDCFPVVECLPCGRPSADFRLEVKVPVDPTCSVGDVRRC